MCKNAVIAILSTSLLFSTEAYAGYFSIILYMCVAVVAFYIVCSIEDLAVKMWNSRAKKVWNLKKFKKEVNKITLNAPTKAS